MYISFGYTENRNNPTVVNATNLSKKLTVIKAKRIWVFSTLLFIVFALLTAFTFNLYSKEKQEQQALEERLIKREITRVETSIHDIRQINRDSTFNAYSNETIATHNGVDYPGDLSLNSYDVWFNDDEAPTYMKATVLMHSV